MRHTDPDMQMPPKKKLSDAQIADLETWVRNGAADPRDGAVTSKPTEIDIEKGKQFWSFQPVQPRKLPPVKNPKWVKSDLDYFVLNMLESKQMTPVNDADRYTLLRRIYIDLIGLPPTPKEIETFINDKSANAVEKVIDELLLSPQFGERWGRHWLDVARFAESTGKAVNISHPFAWRYRDYVIESFNKDKPYDQFIREQLAGDLLPASNDQQAAEQLIATGFLAIGPKDLNERNRLQFELDLADEQIDTTFQAFLGLTVACARCHDHKFDPIPTEDYYALVGIFRSTSTLYGTVRGLQSNRPTSLVQLPSGSGEPVGLAPITKKEYEQMEKQIADLRKELLEANPRDNNTLNTRLRILIQTSTIEGRKSMYNADGTPKLQAMGVRDSSFPRDSVVYTRGEPNQPGKSVARGFPQVLTDKQPTIRRNSGRMELANWIASPENPLTARVMVNRIWSHLFGRGLVSSVDNYGTMGQRPANQELLDYMAGEFVKNGWSIKKTIKQIMLSHSYQLATTYHAENFDKDPDNQLNWRMTPKRVESEVIRDSMYYIADQLDFAPPAGSPLLRQGEGNVRPQFGGGAPFAKGPRFGQQGASRVNRTVYESVVREQLPEYHTLFDFPDTNVVNGERATTIVPAQALYMLNNDAVIAASQSVARKITQAHSSDKDRIEYAYLLFFGRPATEQEIANATNFLKNYQEIPGQRRFGFGREGNAWPALAQAMFAAAEFIMRN
ncbi:MAG: DUF1549 and DUF1553 domain-containing protein [Zavarzinella sp.]